MKHNSGMYMYRYIQCMMGWLRILEKSERIELGHSGMQIFTVLGMFMGSIKYFMKQLVGVERTVCQTDTEAVKDLGNSGQSGTVKVKSNVSKVLEIIKSDGSYRFLILPKLMAYRYYR